MEGKHLKLEMTVVGKQILVAPIDYGFTDQQTIDAVRNKIEEVLPDPSDLEGKGDSNVICKIFVDFEEVFVQKYEGVDHAGRVAIQNPVLQGLIDINNASLQQ